MGRGDIAIFLFIFLLNTDQWCILFSGPLIALLDPVKSNTPSAVHLMLKAVWVFSITVLAHNSRNISWCAITSSHYWKKGGAMISLKASNALVHNSIPESTKAICQSLATFAR
ncbi:uncharacterized protein MELLADRAFT_108489 [Melampsora larici-populina 98AG31]|uniref:Uncharacterized protein n=1 Tax=Melampsora larici-populina (strain 98AG31 / pathotype 3-4-7) TaxID=747676 RepID=F4RT91_MELLP|nr:uncharacterized protein MELLADRAFT_108489 [Melampsora larici-populina 98AG31]EGG04474.1 hypothetical protein MELLADRAFT_108489 [Melampsora larici-populina 98AG31]